MDIEYLHRTGKIPNRYYFQLNNKSAGENYREQRQQLLDDIRQKQQLLDEMQAKIDLAVQKALAEIFSGLDLTAEITL